MNFFLDQLIAGFSIKTQDIHAQIKTITKEKDKQTHLSNP